MANTVQARKRAKQAEKNRRHNASRRSMMRTYVKKVLRALADNNVEEARSAYKMAVPMVDRLANKGLIHKNKAARYKSRLNTRIRNLALAAQ